MGTYVGTLTDNTQIALTPNPLPVRARGFRPKNLFSVSLWEKELRDDGIRRCQSSR